MKRSLHRINIIRGQVEKLSIMIEQDSYCVDIMTQSLAAQKGLASLNKHLLDNHLKHCVVDQIKSGQEEKSIAELIHLYHLDNK